MNKLFIAFSTSGNSGTLGYRIPGIWTHASDGDSNSRAVYICSGINNIDVGHTSKRVVRDQWHSVTVEQKHVNSKYIYSAHVNGELLHTEENRSPRTYQNVNLYISDPWYPSIDGQIKDLKVESSKGKSNLYVFVAIVGGNVLEKIPY